MEIKRRLKGWAFLFILDEGDSKTQKINKKFLDKLSQNFKFFYFKIIRNRDERERAAELLNSNPTSNIMGENIKMAMDMEPYINGQQCFWAYSCGIEEEI